VVGVIDVAELGTVVGVVVVEKFSILYPVLHLSGLVETSVHHPEAQVFLLFAVHLQLFVSSKGFDLGRLSVF